MNSQTWFLGEEEDVRLFGIDAVGRGVDQFSCRNVAQALHRRSPIGPRFGLNVIRDVYGRYGQDRGDDSPN